VIVNAVNGSLHHNGGVAKAIADAAADDILFECRRYINLHGPLRTSEVMHSTSGLLKNQVKFVIHAVGPIYGYTKGPQDCEKLLQNTSLNCFMYAIDNTPSRQIDGSSSNQFRYGITDMFSSQLTVDSDAYNILTLLTLIC